MTSQAGREWIDSHLVLTVYGSDDWVGQIVKPAADLEKSGGIGVFYVDASKAGRVVPLRGLVKGGAMSGVLRRIDDPGSPVKGLQKRQTDNAGEGEAASEAGQGEVAAHTETELQDGQDSAPSNPANSVLTGYEIHADGTGGEIPASPDLRTVPVPLKEDVVAALRARLTHLCGKSQPGFRKRYDEVSPTRDALG